MPVLINLKTYLAELERNETGKPKGQKKEVPNLTQLADAAGISRVPFTRIANGKVKYISMEIIDGVITEMRRRGFPMEVTDFMMYREPDEVE